MQHSFTMVFLGLLLSAISVHDGRTDVDVLAGPALSARADAVKASFDSGEAGFTIRVKDEVIPYRVFGVFVMPNEKITLEADLLGEKGHVQLLARAGTIRETGPDAWTWTSPSDPGLHVLTVSDSNSGDEIRLNVFVKTPFDHESETLNGYRIGRYEPEPLRGTKATIRPDGFVEVTPENRDTPVSPHFTLGQFLCKQQPDAARKYVLVQERLLLKLEMILQEVNRLGVQTNSLNVMSGFRTPWYNRSIGNRTTYSQHLYGSAADVYVDTDGDAWMDDLTGDDEVTRNDAVRLANIIESRKDDIGYRPFIGGLGIYSPAPHRGPFIHVDVRGSLARW